MTTFINKQILELANGVAQNSKCNGQKVGAVIFDGDVILATGYNYTYFDCESKGACYGSGNNCTESELPSTSIHAEIMAIAYCTKNQISPEGTNIYITHVPCLNCLKTICAVGIKTIYFPEKRYDCLRHISFAQRLFLSPNNVKLILT